MSTRARVLAVLILTTLQGVQVSPASGQAVPPYDVVVKNGRLVDGTGNPWFWGDLAIAGDRIVFIGKLPADARARTTIDAKGQIVAPGFIDMHSHSDWSVFEDGAAQSKIRQGVTTEVLGEHSSGGPYVGQRKPYELKLDGEIRLIRRLGDYLDAVDQADIAVNIATYVGLGNIWGSVMGDSFERPTAAQLDEMARLLDQSLAEGAFGLSTMIAEPQESVTTLDDLVFLGKVLKKRGGLYSSHIRNEGTEVFDAIKEAIAVGEKAGIKVNVIHLKIADQRLWGRMGEILALFEAARARGVDVQANVYPYTRGNNDLVSILPPWAHEGGRSALLARLNSAQDRERMKRDILKGLPGWYNHYLAVGGDWSRMLVSAKLSAKNQSAEGKTLDVILAKRDPSKTSASDQLDLMFDLLNEEGGSVGTIYAHHTEADMNLAMSRPWCSIGSDGTALAIDGSLRRGHPHPRSFGTFPRVLGEYVREKKVLGLEDAIRKMTSLNANKLGIRDRGLLIPGHFADITIFDPAKVRDRATYLEPFAYPEGINYVLVNGQVALEKGTPTSARAGKAIRAGR